MAINKVVYGDDVLVDLTPTTAEAEDVIEGKTFVNRSGVLTTGTSTGGSRDYEELDNKPSINNVELVGNKTTSDLGIVIPTVPTNLSSFTDDLGSNPTHTHNQYLTSESEPAFNSSVAKGITSGDITNWNNKSTFSGNYNDLTNKPNIPSQLSELSDDSSHRLVSDTEKSNWNAKSDFSGSYNDLSDKPTNVSSFNNDAGYITNSVNDLTNYSKTTDIQNNKNLAKGVEYIVGTQAAATNKWTGVSTDTGCSSGTIYTGKVIIYHLPVASSSSAATLNLTLPDGTTTGAITIYRLASSTVTTTFGVDCDILMVFDGTNWKVNAYVDSNTNTIGYQLRTEKSNYINGGSTSIYRYQLLVETENGLEAFTSTSNSTKTTKTQLTPSYLPSGDIRYYSASTEITSGSAIGTSVLWQQYYLDLRYSFNITSTTLTTNKPVYMKMSVNNDGTLSPVYSANSGGHPLVQTLPTIEDNYVYVKLGQAYNGYQIQLEMLHPMYEYKNGKIQLYTSSESVTKSYVDNIVGEIETSLGGI